VAIDTKYLIGNNTAAVRDFLITDLSLRSRPDAVFVGGSKGKLNRIIEVCYERLRPGGRLVVNAITFENVSQAYETFKTMDLKPQIMQINISRGVPIAMYTRYESLNPVHSINGVSDRIANISLASSVPVM